MIRIPKIQLFSRKFLFTVAVVYLLLPLFLLRAISFWSVFVFYALFIFVSVVSAYRYRVRERSLAFKDEDLKEKTNLLTDLNDRHRQGISSAQTRAVLYGQLKTIIEKVNADLSLEAITENLSVIAFNLVGRQQGICALYLVDHLTHRLTLFKTRKEDRKSVLKDKEGDIFDLWVMRHSSNLLVENTAKDFRFDSAKVSGVSSRAVGSLVSAPFIAGNNFLGVLRLDHPQPGFYSQEDLRILSVICGIGAIAIENGMLFQRTKEFAIHDGLTGLYTKGYLVERLREEIRRSIRRRGAPLSLLMIDIDFFKRYNDSFGHIAGDIVLKNLSALLLTYFKEMTPVVSRFGGEEFCVILPDTDKDKAALVAENLRQEIADARVSLRQQQERISVSIGVAAFPQDAGYEDELIMKADKAMYQAKNSGRNRVVTA